jgi:HTH-type transcriptional regulator/antitoxin HigA
MDIRPIKTEADYDWALREIERYFDEEPEPGTPDGDRFEVLAALIESYEAKHWPVEAPDPVEAIRFRMEQAGYTQSDLARLLGSKSRASEVLHRKRVLTMDYAFKLHTAWHIPADVLLQPYHPVPEGVGSNDDKPKRVRRREKQAA